MVEAKDKAVVAAPPPLLSLKDLEPHTVEVSLELIQGVPESRRIVKFGVLSYSEYISPDDEIPYPPVPIVPKREGDKTKLVRDEEDPEYKQEIGNVNSQRAMRRLARSLLRGGMFPEWAELPIEEVEKKIAQMPYGAARGLHIAMSRIHQFSHAEVVDKSKNFHEDGPDADADLSGSGMESDDVGEPALLGA